VSVNDDLAEFLSPPRDPEQHSGTDLDQATVTAFTSTRVTLTWRGQAGYIAAYGTWYNPAVNDKVAVLYSGGKLFCLGKMR
jgi:hypothetical protein